MKFTEFIKESNSIDDGLNNLKVRINRLKELPEDANDYMRNQLIKELKMLGDICQSLIKELK